MFWSLSASGATPYQPRAQALGKMIYITFEECDMKIAMIGAGSVVFCKTLLNDLMATPALAGDALG